MEFLRQFRKEYLVLKLRWTGWAEGKFDEDNWKQFHDSLLPFQGEKKVAVLVC